MKKFTLFLLLALMLVVVIMPASAKKLVHPALGMTMDVPADWTADMSGANQIALLLTNKAQADNAQPVITVILSRSGTMTLEQYREFNRNDLKKNPTLRMTMEQAVTIAKTKWYKMIFEFPQNNLKMGAASFFTINKGIAYNITFAAPISLYSRCYPSAEKIIKSFTFPTKKL